MKEVIFVAPQIRKHMLDEHFKSIMDEDELAAWHAFEKLSSDRLGKHKAENFTALVDELLSCFEFIGCNMS